MSMKMKLWSDTMVVKSVSPAGGNCVFVYLESPLVDSKVYHEDKYLDICRWQSGKYHQFTKRHPGLNKAIKQVIETDQTAKVKP